MQTRSFLSLTPLLVPVAIGAAALVMAGCDESVDGLLGGPNGPRAGGDNVLAEALKCTEKPNSRSYTSFDGTKLESSRANENTNANRARFKPHSVLGGEYKRVLGIVPPELEAAAASFNAAPDRWYTEPAHSGVSLNAAFNLSFDACLAAKPAPEHAAAPTPESASAYCGAFMRKAWSRSPSPEEVNACADLAMKKLAEEADVRRRWAYVCASVLSSSNFLTY